MENKIPRRAIMPDWCKAEKAIYDAMQEVEKLSADIRLTQAVTLLSQAKDKVSDYIDELNELADTIQYNQKIK